MFGTDPIARIEKRTKDASGAARGAFAAIREVRMEMKDGHRELNNRIDNNNEKIDAVQTELGDLKGVVGTISGKMDAVLAISDKATSALIDAQKALVESATLKIKTDTDLDAHRERSEIDLTIKRGNADIEETVETKKDRRKRVWWLLGVVGAIITTALAIIKGYFMISS